jgi:hypothetical protein
MSISNYGELKTAVANYLSRDDLEDRIPEFIALAEDRLAVKLRIEPTTQHTPIMLRAPVAIAASEIGGTANAMTFTPATAATAYNLGDSYSFTYPFTQNELASTTTVDVSGLGAKEIGYRRAWGVRESARSGTLVKDYPTNIVYDTVAFVLAPAGGYVIPGEMVEIRSAYLDTTNKRLEYYPPPDFWNRAAVGDTGEPKIYTIEGAFFVVAPVPTKTYAVRMTGSQRLFDLSSDTDAGWTMTNAAGLLLYGALIEASVYIEDDGRALTWATMYDDLLDEHKKADRYYRYPRGRAIMRSDVKGG